MIHLLQLLNFAQAFSAQKQHTFLGNPWELGGFAGKVKLGKIGYFCDAYKREVFIDVGLNVVYDPVNARNILLPQIFLSAVVIQGICHLNPRLT